MSIKFIVLFRRDNITSNLTAITHKISNRRTQESDTKMNKPEKKECISFSGGKYSNKSCIKVGICLCCHCEYNQACDEWEKYHNYILSKLECERLGLMHPEDYNA